MSEVGLSKGSWTRRRMTRTRTAVAPSLRAAGGERPVPRSFHLPPRRLTSLRDPIENVNVARSTVSALVNARREAGSGADDGRFDLQRWIPFHDQRVLSQQPTSTHMAVKQRGNAQRSVLGQQVRENTLHRVFPVDSGLLRAAHVSGNALGRWWAARCVQVQQSLKDSIA